MPIQQISVKFCEFLGIIIGINMKVIYTIGHSNREIEEFIGLLKRFNIMVIFDVRRFPTSRKYPQYTKENLRETLQRVGIGYFWMEDLGGYRGRIRGAEKYKCFRAEGYRNYVAWMQTDAWRKAFRKLVTIATRRTSAIMCAERIPWRCHRKLISDALLAKGFVVIHIIEANRTYKHKYTKCARIINGKLTYV